MSAGGGAALPTLSARAARDGRGMLPGIRIRWWGAEIPTAIAAAGNRLWVANSLYAATGGNDGGAVTELSASTGAPIRVISGRRYRLTDPEAIAADSGRVWVVNGNGGSVTELDAGTGAPIRVISGRRYRFSDPWGIAVGGTSVWVADGDGGLLTEFSAGTGALIRVISGQRYQLSGPAAITAAGNRLWVTNPESNSVTEINATTGALLRVFSAPRYQLSTPAAVAASGNSVWVANSDYNGSAEVGARSGWVTEISATTGALLGVSSAPLDWASEIAAGGAGVWVLTNDIPPKGGGMGPDGSVAELSATSGRLAWSVSSAPFGTSAPGGAITAAGARVWVLGRDNFDARYWVAGLSAATGKLIRVIAS